jgi:Spy/CpxP family protein refolding chaperone
MSEVSIKQKAVLWVGVVFVLGLVLGGIFGYLFQNRVQGDTAGPRSDKARREHIVEELTNELGLTADQQKKLDSVITEAHAKFQAIHEADQPQIEQVRKNARNEIRAFLTPEQQTKFEEHIQKLDEERKQRAQQQGKAQ